jgi:phosphoglycerate dehydrogenase-like enzyme
MTKKRKVIVLSALGENTFSDKQQNSLKNIDAELMKLPNKTTPEELINIIKFYSIVALTPKIGFFIKKDIFQNIPNLKSLVVYATGVDWIDIKAAHKLGVRIYNIKNYCSITVSEHIISMMLTLSRRIHLSQLKSTKKIPLTTSLRGFDLNGKVLGIIGLGHIGIRVANIATALGMKIIYYDTYKKEVEFTACSLERVLNTADIISLSCPCFGKAIIANKEISLMKRGVYIINASRSQLVDKKSILNAIKSRHVAGYAVDDIMLENDEDYEHGRILQTYHTGWYSDESIERGTQNWVDNIIKAYNEIK